MGLLPHVQKLPLLSYHSLIRENSFLKSAKWIRGILSTTVRLLSESHYDLSDRNSISTQGAKPGLHPALNSIYTPLQSAPLDCCCLYKIKINLPHYPQIYPVLVI